MRDWMTIKLQLKLTSASLVVVLNWNGQVVDPVSLNLTPCCSSTQISVSWMSFLASLSAHMNSVSNFLKIPLKLFSSVMASKILAAIIKGST